MADRLRQDGKPLQLTTKGWSRINVDLLDLALELEVPVQDLTDGNGFDLSTWANPGEDAVDRPRNPVHVHTHKVGRKLLEEAVPQAAGNTLFEAAAQGKSALAEARRAWLLSEIATIDSEGTPKTAEVLKKLELATSRATFQEFPEAFDALQKVDLVPTLTRTLQSGLIDEYGWPVLEETVEKLNPDGKQELQFFGAAPHVIVSDGLNFAVVGPTEVVLVHEFQAKKGFKLDNAKYLDGQLLIIVKNNNWNAAMYWSNHPRKTFGRGYYYSSGGLGGAAVELEGGGTFVGEGTVHAGDETVADHSSFFYDGEHFWRYMWHNDEHAVREVDTSGKPGRKSLPAFLEDYLTDGTDIDPDTSLLIHLGDYVKSSPLGSAGGLVGWRVRRKKRVEVDEDGDSQTVLGEAECEGIDGRTWSGYLGHNTVPDGLLRQPGSDQSLPVSSQSSHRSSGHALWDPEGRFEVAQIHDEVGQYNAGQAASLPMIFWHGFEVRDEASSKRLRSLTEKQTKALLAAAQTDRADVDELEEGVPELSATRAAVRKLFSGLKSDRLGRGLEGVLYCAAGLVQQLENLQAARDPSVEEVVADSRTEALVDPAMQYLQHNWYGSNDEPLFPHLTEVARFLAGDREAGPVPPAPFDWSLLLEDLETKLLCGYWSETEVSEPALDFLEAWCELGIMDLPGRFRRCEAEFNGKPPVKLGKKRAYDDPEPPWQLHEYKGNRYIFGNQNQWQDDVQILEYAPDGKFKPLPNSEVEADGYEELTRFWSSEQLLGYVTAFRARERPWLEKETVQATADRLGVTTAEIGLLWFGLPGIDSYENNFLPKQLREQLGLKVKEAQAARQAILGFKLDVRSRLLTALLNGPAEDLWDEGGQRALDRLIEAWGGSVPKRLDVPPEITKALDDATGYSSGSDCIAALADPKKHPRLSATAKWKIEQSDEYGNRLKVSSDTQETFDGDMLKVVSVAVPLLYTGLPAGSQAARTAVTAREQTLKCLGKAGLLFPLGSRYFWGEDSEKAAVDLLKNVLGKTRKKDAVVTADDGLVLGAASDGRITLAFRPAKVKSDDDVAKVRNVLAAIHHREEAHLDWGVLESVNLIRSDGYQAICDRITKGRQTEGQYESNPLHSAPKLVEQVAKKHKVSEEAAVLYLQLLALHDPTTANLKKWNDWSTAQLTRAAKELLGKELILQAKRARASRAYFIPGGWEALKIPFLPIETWKLPLYQIGRDEETGKLQMPLCRILPLQPISDLFETAWQRTLDGDSPQYEEVQ